MISMRTAEERKMRLHERASELRREGLKKAVLRAAWSSLSLIIALTTAVIGFSGGASVLTDGNLAGSSLLSDSAGGYVLTAVIAFTAAVVITVILMKRRKKL